MEVVYYTDLKEWQKAMDLSVDVYRKVRSLPQEELYGLSNQMRRAVVSIPSNIAEGNQRSTTREYIHFLSIAKGSLGELETQIRLCERLNNMSNSETESLITQCSEIGRMLNGLMKRLENKK